MSNILSVNNINYYIINYESCTIYIIIYSAPEQESRFWKNSLALEIHSNNVVGKESLHIKRSVNCIYTDLGYFMHPVWFTTLHSMQIVSLL